MEGTSGKGMEGLKQEHHAVPAWLPPPAATNW